VSYDQLSKFDLAEQCYRRALLLKPDFAAVYNNLGYARLMQGRPEAAIGYLHRAVSLQKGNPRFSNNIVLAYRYFEEKNEIRGDPSSPYPLSAFMKTATSPSPPDSPNINAHQPLWVAPQIDIINGNGAYRMARNLGRYFEARGFNIQRLSNADHFRYPRTQILYNHGQRQDARTLAHVLFGPGTEWELRDNGRATGPVTLLIGRDIAGLNQLFNGRVLIQVANGNGVQGVADRLTGHFRTRGYRVGRPTNAGHFHYQLTHIIYPANHADDARFVARELPGTFSGRLIPGKQSANRIHIIVGKDLQM
jgi:hypothetical protein